MSEKYTATGIIEVINPTKVISDKFSVREFVLQTDHNAEYPQFCKFQCAGKNVPKLDTVTQGQLVTVSFNLRGRAYESKKTGTTDYFTSLDAWNIEPTGRDEIPTRAQTEPQPTPSSDPLPF